MIQKDQTTSSNSDSPKNKPALLSKYEKEKIDSYERLKTKESNT